MSRHLWLSASLCLVASPALSQTAAPAAAPSPNESSPVVTLGPIAVTATRGPKPVETVAGTESVIGQQQLEQQNATSPRDVIRYEPGVSVGNQPARGGQTNYTIRGIGGNRVLLLQDGLRVQDFPGTNAGASNYTRDFVDIDSVRRVEIVRGPSSALYGSDALGGVVNYITKDPADLLDASGRDVAYSSKVGYNGADGSVYTTNTGAVRVGRIEALLSYTRRDGHEQGNLGQPRANPQTYQQNEVLARIVYHATDADLFRFTGEYLNRRLATDIRTDLGTASGVTINNSHGLDTTQRYRVGLEYDRTEPVGFVDTLALKFQYSRLDREELADQLRRVVAGPSVSNRLRLSDFESTQGLFEADLQLTSSADALGGRHLFTYGANVATTDTARPRNRSELNLTTGASTNVVAGETFPNKNFPDTTTTQTGLYAQDQIDWGGLEATPAVRVDVYDLTPHPDRAFANSSGGALVVRPLTEVAVSPKFGLLYRLNDIFSVYGNYAHGFRAPPYDSTNFGFTNFAFGYQIVPNGNLKSETSDGGEIGLRGRIGADASFQLAGFYNRYSNFIDTATIGFTSAGLQQFQYVNLPSVNIYGAEAKADWRFAPRFTWRGALAYARGENEKTHQAIDSVDPLKLVNGVSFQHESGFGADVIATAALRHSRVSTTSYFKAPGYVVLDLAGHYDFNRNLTLNAGLYNVANQKYFNAQDVIGIAASSTTRDLYSQPGRYFAFNLTARL